MRQFGVIADDMTGAMDCGLQFRKAGLQTIVHLGVALVDGRGVTVLDTESREDTPDAAYVKVRQAARWLKGRPIYKKIDSTLRGNIGRELDAVMDELNLEVALVAPAFPGTGRRVVGGRLTIEGSPMLETDFSQDPLCPATDHIPTLLERQSYRSVAHIAVSVTQRGVAAVDREIRRRTADIVVIDTAKEEHLRTVARVAALLGPGCLTCGSAGLASALPAGFEMVPSVPITEARTNLLEGQILVVVGSVREATARQINHASGDPNTSLVQLDPLQTDLGVCSALQSASELLHGGKDVLLTTSFDAFVPRLGAAVSEALGSICADLLKSHCVSGLVVTGGTTALAVCRALKIVGVEIEGEVAPGVPAGRAVGGRWEGFPLITKAGGFGTPSTLTEAMNYLRGGA